MYLAKPAFLEMQELMTGVVVDGVYRLSPQLQPDKCLGASQIGINSIVQLYNDECNKTNQKWNITWLGDGTYRFSLQSTQNFVLGTYNVSASLGHVQTYNWLDNANQRWAFSAKGNDIFRIVPQTAWWKVMTTNGTSNIGIVDYFTSKSQHWILTKV
ncbi:unnamed protein product [Adineta steineri]|uniref:Ricin B lectin domain-containing protein n=1 Tax=Adineta steineri TaxID=433720 RepID=A0A815PRM5_9BILA|nr:unnamed protein product [Adineta steineri]CAF1164351.1 unnamed protein product [Adineta steineri]CAF1452976.1 unnamed protein product [Adineta steineri]CAF1631117.1 unnamed protein product [Adineta steineri]